MDFFMSRFAAQTYAAMRIVAGLLYMCHGAQKLFGFPLPVPAAPPFILYVAGPIEFVGGLLIAAGLCTRWTAFICSGQMAAAYWFAHFPRGPFPLANGGELAALYCFIFLFFFANGPGIWSLDAAFFSRDAGTRTP
ncbi:MAG: DoxX family protein [Thermodesulfobacteriota bacterium]